MKSVKNIITKTNQSYESVSRIVSLEIVKHIFNNNNIYVFNKINRHLKNILWIDIKNGL